MTGAKLSLRAHVENDHVAPLQPPRKLLSRQLLHPVTLAQILVGQHRHLGDVANRRVPNGRPQLRHPVAREP